MALAPLGPWATPADGSPSVLESFHSSFAWFVILGNAIAGAWSLAAHWLPAARHRSMWAATAVVQVSIFVEVAAGSILLSTTEREMDQFHAFYGFVALATVGIIYSYRSQLEQYRYLLYGFGGLFLMGLALRSLQFSS